MIDYKIILGYIATGIALVAFIPYFRNIFTGKTKPHAFSWLLWTVLTGTGFAAQVVKQGGAGAWATGATSIGCFVIFIWALVKGDRRFSTFDWLALSAAGLALVLWAFTNDPTAAIILVSIIDMIGMFITLRKGFYKPWEETASIFAIAVVKWVITLFALQSFVLVTWLYPVSMAFSNGFLAITLLIRRRQLRNV